jgi:hypothetical protein
VVTRAGAAVIRTRRIVAKRSPIGMKLLLTSGANVAEASKSENNGRIVADVTKAPLRP